MAKGEEGRAVNVLIADEPPLDALSDEAQALLDDLLSRMIAARTDRERFYLCAAVSAAEQMAWALLTLDGGKGYRYRTTAEVSQCYFGRLVSAL